MSQSLPAQCRLVRPGSTYDGKQGFTYVAGIAAETVGSQAICMHLLTVPPGARAKAHYHATHETAIYCISGETVTYFGDRLEHVLTVKTGDMFYIPAGVPHVPVNRGDVACSVVIARTDPNEQESVVLTPELDALVP